MRGITDYTDSECDHRVNGELNGESIIGQDLNCYVVTEDGRTYTAISRLPGHLGWQLQAAVPLGTVISWLFAKPRLVF